MAALHKAGTSLRQIALANDYAENTLGAALTRSYPKAEALIANALNLPVSTIWPERERLRAEKRARLLPNQSHGSARGRIMSAKIVYLPAVARKMLPSYSKARAALILCSTIDEAKDWRDKAAAVRAYAIKARDREMEIIAAQIRLEAERRAGQILIEMKASGLLASKEKGRPRKVSGVTTLTLEAHKISRDESSKWQRIARLSKDQYELRQRRIREGSRNPIFSSLSDEWLTPRKILELSVSVLGEIDLDPCAERGEPHNVPAREHWTKDQNGLGKRIWTGTVFMNPPFCADRVRPADEAVDRDGKRAARAVGRWCERLIDSYRIGTVTQAIALVPARTDTPWFRLFEFCPVCFVAGRLKFHGTAGGESNAPFPSAVFYLGSEKRRFSAVFAAIGHIREPANGAV